MARHQAGGFNAAELIYRKLIAQNSQHAHVLPFLGILMHQQGQTLNLIEKSLQLSPDNATYHNNKGNILSTIGRETGALLQYQQVLAIDPRFAKALCNIALVYKNQGSPSWPLTTTSRP